MDIFDALFDAYVNHAIDGLNTLEVNDYISVPDNSELEEKVGEAIFNAERHGFINGLRAGLMLLGK